MYPLFLLITFGLKSILLNIKMATPACLLGSFGWSTFFRILYGQVSFLCAAEEWILNSSLFLNLYLFIGELSRLMLRNINDQ